MASAPSRTLFGAHYEEDPVFIPPDRPSWSLLFTRSETRDGTHATDDTLIGPVGPNTFYIGFYESTGHDVINGFERRDVFVTNAALHTRLDGVIALEAGVLAIGGPEQDDTVAIRNPEPVGLRFLGERDLLFVYGLLTARPLGATEGTLGHGALFGTDTLVGTDARDLFFFDTAIRLDLGSDVIKRFDAGDRIITTSALIDPNMDGCIKADFADRFAIRDFVDSGPELGSGIAKIFAPNGRAVSTLVLEEVLGSEIAPLYVYARAGDHTPPPEISF